MRGGAGAASRVEGGEFPREPLSIGSRRMVHSVRQGVRIESSENAGGLVETGVTGASAGQM